MTLSYFIAILVLVLLGCLMPIQVGLNSRLSILVGDPLWGAFVSFLGGTVLTLVLLMATSRSLPNMDKLQQIPWIYFIGGILGACFVLASIYFLPKLGATTLMVSFILGQLLGSVLLDHFGILTNHPITADLRRVLGVILVFIGMIMVQKY